MTIFYPAIDLKDSSCVRLYQGNMDEFVIFNKDPVSQVKIFEKSGCEWIHIVDLNGAIQGKSIHGSIVREMLSAAPGLSFQLGGGVRSIEDIYFWIKQGVNRVVLGSMVAHNPDCIYDVVKKFGDKVAVSVDCRNGFVSADGWVNTLNIDIVKYVKHLSESGVRTIIVTDIERDGTMRGSNISMVRNVLDTVSSIDVIASGGISSIEDIKELKSACPEIKGVISGKALYEKKLSVTDAIDVLRSDGSIDA